MTLSSSGDIISLIQKQLGLNDETNLVLEVWDKEFAPFLRYADLIGMKDGQLIVEVLSSVHFQELALKRHEIITKINQVIGKESAVKGIQIRLKS